jgi:hypothetical protein
MHFVSMHDDSRVQQHANIPRSEASAKNFLFLSTKYCAASDEWNSLSWKEARSQTRVWACLIGLHWAPRTGSPRIRRVGHSANRKMFSLELEENHAYVASLLAQAGPLLSCVVVYREHAIRMYTFLL